MKLPLKCFSEREKEKERKEKALPLFLLKNHKENNAFIDPGNMTQRNLNHYFNYEMETCHKNAFRAQ